MRWACGPRWPPSARTWAGSAATSCWQWRVASGSSRRFAGSGCPRCRRPRTSSASRFRNRRGSGRRSSDGGSGSECSPRSPEVRSGSGWDRGRGWSGSSGPWRRCSDEGGGAGHRGGQRPLPAQGPGQRRGGPGPHHRGARGANGGPGGPSRGGGLPRGGAAAGATPGHPRGEVLRREVGAGHLPGDAAAPRGQRRGAGAGPRADPREGRATPGPEGPSHGVECAGRGGPAARHIRPEECLLRPWLRLPSEGGHNHPGHRGARWRQVPGDDSLWCGGGRAVPPGEERCTRSGLPGRGAEGGQDMKVLPAIDLRRGASVQLVGGELTDEKIHLPDPLEVARRFLTAGFKELHIVDLDAAAGTGSNATVVASLLQVPGMQAEVGGGVRDADSIQRLLDLGAARVMVGTRALEEPSWLEEVAFRFPGKLMLAADARGRQVVTRGWTRTLTQDVGALVAGA